MHKVIKMALMGLTGALIGFSIGACLEDNRVADLEYEKKDLLNEIEEQDDKIESLHLENYALRRKVHSLEKKLTQEEAFPDDLK